MIDILMILMALGLLMYLAFRGVTLLVLAPGMALLAALLTGGLPLLSAYTQIFMASTGDFIVAFFPLFMLGAIFGKLMDDSGSAKAIARWVIAKLGPARAIIAVVLCCGVLTYGGVSLFVVAFAIFPVAAALFRDADIPKRLRLCAVHRPNDGYRPSGRAPLRCHHDRECPGRFSGRSSSRRILGR